MDKQELEDALESLEGGYKHMRFINEQLEKDNKGLEETIKDLKECCSPPTLTEEDIERIVAKHHDCYEVEKELKRLEKENKELKQELDKIKEQFYKNELTPEDAKDTLLRGISK